MKPLGLMAVLLFLDGAVAVAGEGTPPSRPSFPRDLQVAPPTRIPDMTVEPAPPGGQPVRLADVPKSVRRAVVADAAARWGVTASAVVLARAERVTWSDGSLGCAEPGMRYTQALVPGYRIVATSGAQESIYHTDAHAQARPCAPVRPRSGGAPN